MRRICLWVPLSELKLSDKLYLKLRDPIIYFACKVTIIGSYIDYISNTYRMIINHPEFPEVPEGCMCEEYSFEDAKYRFPFLFDNVNPILYRKFV